MVNLAFEDFEDLDPESFRLPITEGGPFHPYLLDQALETCAPTYHQRGYAEAQVSAREDWNAEHTLVDLTFDAFEGPQMVLDRVIVRGNRRTESEVIRRTLGLERGRSDQRDAAPGDRARPLPAGDLLQRRRAS